MTFPSSCEQTLGRILDLHKLSDLLGQRNDVLQTLNSWRKSASKVWPLFAIIWFIFWNNGFWSMGIFRADCMVILRYCKSKSGKKCRSNCTLKHQRILNLQFAQFFKGLKRGLLDEIRCSQWLQGMVLDGIKGFQWKNSGSMTFNFKSDAWSCVLPLELIKSTECLVKSDQCSTKQSCRKKLNVAFEFHLIEISQCWLCLGPVTVRSMETDQDQEHDREHVVLVVVQQWKMDANHWQKQGFQRSYLAPSLPYLPLYKLHSIQKYRMLHFCSKIFQSWAL